MVWSVGSESESCSMLVVVKGNIWSLTGRNLAFIDAVLAQKRDLGYKEADLDASGVPALSTLPPGGWIRFLPQR